MTGRLYGQVALVTGAGRGIGRAIALKFAQEGADLVINDVDDDVLAEAASEAEAFGGRVVLASGDITAEDFAGRFITAGDALGGPDIIVNNAGYTWDNVVQKMDDEQWHSVLDVHLTAPFRILRAAQPVIKRRVGEDRTQGRRKMRRVINISSVAGLFGNAGQANYATAKAGILGLTQTIAKEWGRYDVTVNAIAYALIKTRIAGDRAAGETMSVAGRDVAIGINSDVLARMEGAIPLGRAGTPEEAAGAAFLFTLPEADYVSGQTLLCSGGFTGL
jgi:3-oxoacyl-[acyl-carrier protein] reductase